MADTHGSELEEQRARKHEASPAIEHGEQSPRKEQDEPELDAHSFRVLHDRHAADRVNRPVRASSMEKVQRTYGNHAAHRFAQRMADNQATDSVEQSPERMAVQRMTAGSHIGDGGGGAGVYAEDTGGADWMYSADLGDEMERRPSGAGGFGGGGGAAVYPEGAAGGDWLNPVVPIPPGTKEADSWSGISGGTRGTGHGPANPWGGASGSTWLPSTNLPDFPWSLGPKWGLGGEGGGFSGLPDFGLSGIASELGQAAAGPFGRAIGLGGGGGDEGGSSWLPRIDPSGIAGPYGPAMEPLHSGGGGLPGPWDSFLPKNLSPEDWLL